MTLIDYTGLLAVLAVLAGMCYYMIFILTLPVHKAVYIGNNKILYAFLLEVKRWPISVSDIEGGHSLL